MTLISDASDSNVWTTCVSVCMKKQTTKKLKIEMDTLSLVYINCEKILVL